MWSRTFHQFLVEPVIVLLQGAPHGSLEGLQPLYQPNAAGLLQPPCLLHHHPKILPERPEYIHPGGQEESVFKETRPRQAEAVEEDLPIRPTPLTPLGEGDRTSLVGLHKRMKPPIVLGGLDYHNLRGNLRGATSTALPTDGVAPLPTGPGPTGFRTPMATTLKSEISELFLKEEEIEI